MQKRSVNEASRFHIAKGSDWAKLKDIIPGETGEPEDDIWVENERTQMIRNVGGIFVNDAFIPLWHKKNKLQFLAGGYGSSKTTYIITRLLVKCIEHKQFKCYYGRQKKTEARELHDNIVREIIRNGWKELFDFSEKPNGTPDILCKANGNVFKLFGCDDVDSLKGIDNPTDILVDEINQISFKSFGMLLTRLRTPGVELQMTGCFNNCDVYPDHWIAKYIYGKDEPETKSEINLVKALRKLNIERHHSIYTDNFFQNPAAYLQTLIVKAGGDDDTIEAYTQGKWGVKLNAQPYYKQFDSNRHVDAVSYDPRLPLHISFDENVNPYFPCLIGQQVGTELRLIDEIAAENPNNTLIWICGEICERYKDHDAGVFIYGDASSRKGDVKLEKGKNLFTLAMEYLSMFDPVLRVPDSNPSNEMRGNFINTIFSKRYADIDIIVSPLCEHMVEDLRHTEEDPSGKGKAKNRVKVNGIQGVQRWGHFGDCMDYLVCELFFKEYVAFQNGSFIAPVTGGRRKVNNSVDTRRVSRLIPERTRQLITKKRVSRNGY